MREIARMGEERTEFYSSFMIGDGRGDKMRPNRDKEAGR